jgi:hypothetical protein
VQKRPIVVDIDNHRYVLPLNLTYCDIQARVSVVAQVDAERILFTNLGQIMLPSEYPFVSTFPQSREFSYPILNRPVTVCSISRYHALSFVFVSSLFVRESTIPVWVPQNKSAAQIAKILPKFLPACTIHHRMIIQCSRGTAKAIVKLFLPNDQIRDKYFRMDLVRWEVPRDKWRTIELLRAQQPFSLEVRRVSSRQCEEFVGVSRLLTVQKHFTVRNIAIKMAKLDNTNVKNLNVDVFLFTSERSTFQQDLELNDNLCERLELFVQKLIIPKERICIGIWGRNEGSIVRMNREAKSSQRSSVDIHRLVAGNKPS